MKLFFSKGACSLACRIIINELSLPCEFESVDLRAKKTASGDDFFQINPKGAVPVLITDEGETLTENAVIQQYLADKSHAMQLLPPLGDFKRYRVLEWLNYISTDFHKTCGLLFNPDVSQDFKDNLIIPLAKKRLDYVDKRLGENTYLVGDNFTLPDAYFFVMITWVLYFKFDLAKWSNVERYFAQLKTRPSIHRSLEQEGLL